MNNHPISILGIASLSLSILAAVLVTMLLVFVGLLTANLPGGLDPSANLATMVGLLCMLFMGLAFTALGLGIGGLVRKEPAAIWSILGISIATCTILGTSVLMILGMFVQ